ncbi:MAG TPA: Ig-like domain-containing protein, partial [Pyrinomonadaceae bacterium]|nr:Ig-like domain-containing protein [Pyrinomonadaceae bacterium]
MLRLKPFIILLCMTLAPCVIGLRIARSQADSLRRLTSTTEDGISTNPSLSGDGRRLAFESTEDLSGAGGSDRFRAIRADLVSDPPAFIQMGATRAAAPAVSQDGSRIAFSSRENPLGTNPDGNSEIFLFDGAALRQITNTTPGDLALRVRNGNFQPSISDDGRLVAFASNRDLLSLNPDANLEIFIYDTSDHSFTQLTNTSGTVGNADAKISGDGSTVAYIRDGGATVSAARDLILQNRLSGSTRVIASGVYGLALTYGRAISDDGSRVVYAAETAADASQVFLFDGRNNLTRQITTLGARAVDVPLHPTISGDGSRLAFATRRNVIGGNSDNSVELYTLDIPAGRLTRVTSAPSAATADVVSSLNDDGTLIAFNFPRVLSGPVSSSDLANNSEIYIKTLAERPSFSSDLRVLNGASFGNEPAATQAVAPESIAVAFGSVLAFTSEQAQRLSDGTFPRILGGTTLTVNGRPAQIFYVSPAQVNFLFPAETETGTASVVVTNSEGFQTRGMITVLRGAPGVFTYTGDGRGEGLILDADTLLAGPFDPTSGLRRLIIFATGVRRAASSQTFVTIGGRIVTVESIIASPSLQGLDEIHVLLPADLRGAGTVDLVVRAEGRESNHTSVMITGDARRDIVINEILADPPGSAPADLIGDANQDGTRDSSQDEFIEMVNSTARDLDIGGYQILTRGGSGTSDVTRHTFAPGTILQAGTALVIFGGGNIDANNPVFGGAQVLKASSGGLSLVNTGGVVTLRAPSLEIAGLVSYGGATGLNGNADQSLTRSPDVAGGFTLHGSAPGSDGRAFTPGTRNDGSPFVATPMINRIEVSPASETVLVGARQQFTARAFDDRGQELSGIIFQWRSSSTSVATIDQNGLATGVSQGTSEIKAFARGVQSMPAILTVRQPVPILTRIEITPSSTTAPVGGTRQFTARGFDQNEREITGLTFSWTSGDVSVATIDQSGLATPVNPGMTKITVMAQGISGSAILNVVASTVVINEVLADPPDDVAGDANHDGVRSGTDDEFIELVNATGETISISGWTIRTRSLNGGAEVMRHTFAADT